MRRRAARGESSATRRNCRFALVKGRSKAVETLGLLSAVLRFPHHPKHTEDHHHEERREPQAHPAAQCAITAQGGGVTG